jgi:hypothetical protein
MSTTVTAPPAILRAAPLFFAGFLGGDDLAEAFPFDLLFFCAMASLSAERD